MSNEQRAFDLFVGEITDKLHKSDMDNTMLRARIVFLEQDIDKLEKHVTYLEGIIREQDRVIEIINKKESNKVSGFSHKQTIKGR